MLVAHEQANDKADVVPLNVYVLANRAKYDLKEIGRYTQKKWLKACEQKIKSGNNFIPLAPE